MTTPAQPITTPDITSTLGFFLTLIGLIGTFFYVHLSNWFRDLLELKAKYELNAVGESPQRQEGRLECRFQLTRLLNHVPFLVAIVISGFIVTMSIIAGRLTAQIQPEPRILLYYRQAGLYFIIIYFSLTLYLLIHGYLLAFFLRKKITHPK